jgi:hypothetical protein
VGKLILNKQPRTADNGRTPASHCKTTACYEILGLQRALDMNGDRWLAVVNEELLE